MSGYLRSLALENPKFSWKVVSVDGEPGVGEIARRLSNELCDAGWLNSEVRYQGEHVDSARQIQQIRRYRPQEKAGTAVKHQGVYIVTGGLGGLGYIFGEHLAREYGAKLVLTGRSALDAAQQAKLAALGGDEHVVYVQADVSDPAQADAVVLEARRR